MKQIATDTGICFFKVSQPDSLLQFLQGVDYSPLAAIPLAEELLREGCVYVDQRRVRSDLDLREGQVVRVHTRQKRFPFPGALRERINFENDDFLVLDKPSDFPTHPTLDNFRENAKVRLEEEMGIQLYTTHRLDVPTQGLLILAKKPEAQTKINKSFSLGRVDKIYRMICEKKVPGGHHVHFINPETKVPRETSLQEDADWWRCELLVDRCEPHSLGFGTQVILLTGKTHQVRTQMKALGAPLLGDPVYGGAAYPQLMLECYRMSLQYRGDSFEFTRKHSILDDAGAT